MQQCNWAGEEAQCYPFFIRPDSFKCYLANVWEPPTTVNSKDDIKVLRLYTSSAVFSIITNVSNVSNVSNVANVTNVTNVSHVTNVSNVSNVANVTNVTNVSHVTNVSNVANVANVTNIPNVSNVTVASVVVNIASTVPMVQSRLPTAHLKCNDPFLLMYRSDI
nr:hypothetical protein BaRGS_004983 [Batillaria attramentaria]